MIKPAPPVRSLDSLSTATVPFLAISFPALFIAGLFFYKWRASLLAIQKVWLSGVLSVRTDVIVMNGTTGLTALATTLNYFAVIWPALVFGILISAAVRAFIPREWIIRLFTGRGLSPQISAGAAGAPLMLCSCCVAPVFNALYERSSRLGPSLAFMLASPSLNPAALILTFMLFTPRIAATRLLMAAIAVLFGALLLERLFAKPLPAPSHRAEEESIPYSGLCGTAVAFFRSLLYVVIRTVPALIVGVLCSMLLVHYVPKEWAASGLFRYLIVVVTALIAVPLALPTFFEIPLALGLLAAGAPLGAAAALLFAGPAVNLPSLLTLAKSTNWKIAMGLAVLVWAIAATGGLLLS